MNAAWSVVDSGNVLPVVDELSLRLLVAGEGDRGDRAALPLHRRGRAGRRPAEDVLPVVLGVADRDRLLQELVDLIGERAALRGAQRVARTLHGQLTRALLQRRQAAQRAVGRGQLRDGTLHVRRLLRLRADRRVQLQILRDLRRIVARLGDLLPARELRAELRVKRALLVDRLRLLGVDRRSGYAHPCLLTPGSSSWSSARADRARSSSAPRPGTSSGTGSGSASLRRR